MNIYVNTKPHDVATGATIRHMLDVLSITSVKGMAVAVNSQVIPGTQWETHILNNEDKLTLIKATQGG